MLIFSCNYSEEQVHQEVLKYSTNESTHKVEYPLMLLDSLMMNTIVCNRFYLYKILVQIVMAYKRI